MIDISDLPEIGDFMKYFEEISAIPRGSGNSDGIAEYLCSFARVRGLEYHRDKANNVVIKKGATLGLEDRPTVIIQGHSDMVAAKLADCDIDMEREGLRLYRDGDFLRAEGTTLGADNGIAVAYALALLDGEDIPHPALECLFTADEEIGLIGANALDPELISGRIMINVDGGGEGVFTVGCAGGLRADLTLPIRRVASEGNFYSLSVTGLAGGHSGTDIHKGRINAIKLLCECLSDMGEVRLAALSGGNADNAIPREAEAVFSSRVDADTLRAVAERLEETYGISDGGLRIKFAAAEPCENTPDVKSTEAVLRLISDIHTGVVAMSKDMEGLVETSQNVGVARLTENEFHLTVSIRSSVEGEKPRQLGAVEAVARSIGASVFTRGDYPGWEYTKSSPLREIMCRVYKEQTGKDARIIALHAGLECGIFSKKLLGLDCVAIGPDSYGIHSPSERLSLPSAKRTWELIKEVLKNI